MGFQWFGNRYSRNIVFLVSAIVLIIVLVTGIAYTLFTDVVVFQSAQMGLRTTDMLAENAMRMYEEIKALFDQILLSSQLGKVLYYTECTPGELLVALKQLNAYRSNSSFIDSIYVYSAVNSNFYISSDTAALAMQTREEMFDAGALEILNSIFDYDNAVPVVRTQEFTYPIWERTELVTYVRYNTLSREVPMNTLFINLRKEAYFQYFDAWPDTQDDVLLYLNAEGEALFASKPAETWEEALHTEIPADSDRGSLRMADGRLLCYNRALPSGWTLIYLTNIDPAGVVGNADGTFWRIVLLGIAGLLLIGLLIMFFAKFITLIHQRTAEAQQAQEERSRMLALHKRRILLEALFGSTGTDIQEIIPENTAAALCVIVPQKQTHACALAAKKCLSDAMRDTMRFAVTDDRHRVSVCVSTANLEDLSGYVQSICKSVAGRMGECLYVFVSDEFEGFAGLADAYTWCVDMSAYRTIIPPCFPFTSSELETREALGDLYPEDQVQKMVESLYNLDLASALAALEETFALLKSLLLRAYRTGLLKVTLAVSDNLNILAKKYNIMHYENALPLYLDQEADLQQDLIEQAIRVILADIQDIRDEKYESMMIRIGEHIHRGIADSQFSPASVAEKEGLSPSHLSRITRKQRGVSLAEWIFEERIACAKALLEHTAYSMAEIAGLSGFYDPQYFYKAFKRKCGVTPGIYRQLHKKEHTNAKT